MFFHIFYSHAVHLLSSILAHADFTSPSSLQINLFLFHEKKKADPATIFSGESALLRIDSKTYFNT